MADYNGWSNYETWCVSMWLSNDEAYYEETRGLAEDYKYAEAGSEDDEQGARNEAIYQLGRALKAFVEDLPEVMAVTEGPATFVVDLLGAAMSDVDWDEIAANLFSELS